MGRELERSAGQVVQDHRCRARGHPGRMSKVRVDPVGLPMGEGVDGDQGSDSDIGQEPPARRASECLLARPEPVLLDANHVLSTAAHDDLHWCDADRLTVEEHLGCGRRGRHQYALRAPIRLERCAAHRRKSGDGHSSQESHGGSSGAGQAQDEPSLGHARSDCDRDHVGPPPAELGLERDRCIRRQAADLELSVRSCRCPVAGEAREKAAPRAAPGRSLREPVRHPPGRPCRRAKVSGSMRAAGPSAQPQERYGRGQKRCRQVHQRAQLHAPYQTVRATLRSKPSGIRVSGTGTNQRAPWDIKLIPLNDCGSKRSTCRDHHPPGRITTQTNPTATAVRQNRRRANSAAGIVPRIAQPVIVIAPSTVARSNPRAITSNQRLAGSSVTG